jgi:uncharacterized protein YeaO (DUF488 family)
VALKTKRVYDQPEKTDGKRILVDRLWPRGLSREKAQIDEWFRDIAPSDELRKWFGHKPERWEEFQERYREELRSAEKQQQLIDLRSMIRAGTVTLLFASKDGEHNNAIALTGILKQK